VGFLASGLEGVDDEMKEALSDTLVSCDGLAHIIDNMEVLALALSGRGALPRARLDIVPILTETALRNQALAKSHGVELTLDAKASARALHVLAHRDMLARAIGNLVRNSIQHASGKAEVRVSMRHDAAHCIVAVHDTGMPLSEQLRSDGFTAPGQLIAKSARGGRYSRGLGLFSARVAAEAAGAQIRVLDVGASSNTFELVVDSAPA
jgi:signal transduction histidine kinase